MLPIQTILMSDFTYELSEDKIAKFPLNNRTDSKLLHFKNGIIKSTQFEELIQLLSPSDSLFFNNAKVIPARLFFHKSSGARIEILCLEPHLPTSYELIFQTQGSCEWKTMVGNLKKWKHDEILMQVTNKNGENITLSAKLVRTESNYQIVRFEWNHEATFDTMIQYFGELPIPPYLERETTEQDQERYQTIYAKTAGSVAAPTAGLHFSVDFLEKLRKLKIKMHELTLHVGAGTFRPVKATYAHEHIMHPETIVISQSLLHSLLQTENIVAVGTTSLRTLESIYWIGLRILNKENNPWELSQTYAYEHFESATNISKKQSMSAILEELKTQNIQQIYAITSIFIFPSYRFQMVKKILTNFHQPQSSLLLLIAAFIGQSWESVYEYALNNQFRFLSYGDSSLLEFNDLQ